ncbi:hypothetical protein [Kineococcus sp. SYSU DK005]|uniref:hypothetical protein n=1 Tax=Kineococcus sp. SYSU DK005 TaxID=3383126 RepID=UPI003D7E97D1
MPEQRTGCAPPARAGGPAQPVVALALARRRTRARARRAAARAAVLAAAVAGAVLLPPHALAAHDRAVAAVLLHDLRVAAQAQRTHHDLYGTYAGDLAQLPGGRPSTRVRVVSAGPDGFCLLARARGVLRHATEDGPAAHCR